MKGGHVGFKGVINRNQTLKVEREELGEGGGTPSLA